MTDHLCTTEDLQPGDVLYALDVMGRRGEVTNIALEPGENAWIGSFDQVMACERLPEENAVSAYVFSSLDGSVLGVALLGTAPVSEAAALRAKIDAEHDGRRVALKWGC